MEDRDFIDFEFNGHWASEFNLLAVSNSDRYSNSFYGTVNANTADMVGKYGVYKWKTQIGEKRFSINIAYDNVDLNTLRKIKEWLNPFVIGKLVFKEEPYKYYWVSLAEDPEISFLPFLTEETVVDGRRLKKGVYKGEFVINFICFDNYGYSDWNSFDENYDYIVKELEISDDEVNFDDGSDNSLIISQIDGNLKQNKESQAYYSTSQESNRLTLNNITNTDTEKWSIKGGNSQVVQNYNSIQVEGESFNLNGVDNSKTMDIKLKGNHNQETREGYNLLIPPKTQTKNGITFTVNDDNSITIKGTATETTSINFINETGTTMLAFKAGTYRLLGCPKGGGSKTYRLGTNMVSGSVYDVGDGVEITIDEAVTNKAVWLSVYPGATYNNLTFYPMLVKGTEAKPYEQYGATPSLKFPSEIKAVGSNINLLNNTLQSQTINGLTVTVNEDKSVKVVGTAASNTNIIFDRHGGKIEAGIYTLKDCQTFIESDENKGWWRNGETKTFTSTATISSNGFYKYYESGTTVNDTLYPMVVNGTVATSYAQYKQGSANVVVCNENLFKETSNNKKTNTAYGYLISGNYMLKKGKKYAVSFDTNNNGGKVYLNEYVLKFIGSTYDAACDGKRHTIIATAIVDGYQNNRNLIKTGVATTDYYDVSNISVCEYVNNSSSDFVEHQEQTITMPVQQEMLEGDYFNFDKEKEIHNWVKLTLDGTEDWNLDNTYQGIYQYSFQPPKSAIYNDNTKNIESNYFRGVAFQPDSWKKDNCITMYTTSNVRYIRIMTSRYKTVDEFKALLKEKHDAGNPVIVYYKLETPIELNFTEKQKTAAKQFKAITPYKNITHIYSTDEITPKMVVDYNITRAMPSLDYPSEIETVSGSAEIDVVNSNLLDFNVTQDSKVTVNEDGTITINGQGGFTLAFKQFTAKANTKYYIKWELVSGTVDTSKSSGNSFLNPLSNTNIKEGEFKENVVESDKDISGFWINNMAVFTNAVIKFWANTDKSDFIPHQSQSYIMPIQQDMLDGDYFDFDREKEVHNWGKSIFDENDNIECSHNNGTFQFKFGRILENTNSSSKTLCNISKYWKYVWNENGCFVSFQNYFYILCKENEFGFNADMTTNEAISLLKEKLTQNNLICYYQLTTPTELDFTSEQKIVARQLKRSNFYKGTTNVILDNDLAKVKVNYDGYDGAPSEKHPSSVDGVKDKVDIIISNQNLFNFNKLNTSNSNLTIANNKLSGNNSVAIIGASNDSKGLLNKILVPGTYTVSFDILSKTDNWINSAFLCCQNQQKAENYANGISVNLIANEKKRASFQFEVKEKMTQFGIVFYLSKASEYEVSNITMVKGTEEDYIEYKQQQISLPVQEEMYIGDYIDETGEHHKMTKIVIDGTNTRVSMTKKPLNNYIQTYLSTSEQFDPQVDINCYSNIMKQEYNARFGFVNTFIKGKTGIYFHFKGDLLGDADCNDIGMNNWFKEQYDKGTPAYIIGPLKKEKVLPLTDEQKSALNVLKNYTYSYPGANTISISGDTKPKITASYIPQQDINIDFVLEGSNLLNDSAFYYNNDIYLKAFDEIDSGNPSTSGISSEREVYLYNAGNADASLKLTFDLIILAENSPLTIVTSKGRFTKNGFEEINNYSQFSISNFAHYKPFVDIFDGVLSNWVIEIDSDLCEVYLKHKTNKDKVISLNRFNDNQSFLKLAGSDFVDYSKSFPTSLEEIKDSAIENTIFNKISLKESAQNYRLKNVSLDWKHTYL